MPLLLLDLDNTLHERAIAYREWAVDYLAERGADPGLLAEMIRIDKDGARPKPLFRAKLTALLGLDPDESGDIVKTMRQGVLEHLHPDPTVLRSLTEAREAGWRPFIVTNGATGQQEKKIDRLGLAPYVDGWVISESEGVEKPDPELFRIAARRAGGDLASAWMIGDSAEADVAGARAAGVPVVYLRRGRTTYPDVATPDAVADSLPDAVTMVLATLA